MTGDGRGDKRGQTGVRMDEEEKVDFGTTQPLQTVCAWFHVASPYSL